MMEANVLMLSNRPSKAKYRLLARMILALTCLIPCQTMAQDIRIQSEEHEDTIIRVGPGNEQVIRLDSDPDNGTQIIVTPPPPPEDEKLLGPIFITPEIIIRK